MERNRERRRTSATTSRHATRSAVLFAMAAMLAPVVAVPVATGAPPEEALVVSFWTHYPFEEADGQLLGLTGEPIAPLVKGQGTRVSPDGSKLAYMSEGTVYVAEADGSGSVAVTTGLWPAWSPDGTHLAFIAQDQNESLGVYTMPASPAAPRTRVADIGRFRWGHGVDWSPDGTKIVFSWSESQVGGPELVVVDLDTLESASLGEGGSFPRWSPDGDRILFISRFLHVLMLIGSDGSNPVELDGPVQTAAWAPDGDHIVWSSGRIVAVRDLRLDLPEVIIEAPPEPFTWISVDDWATVRRPRFVDVPLAHLFSDDVEWAATAGITRGCNPPTNDRYCPNDPVTRGQIAAMLSRALGLTDTGTIDFTDDDDSIFATDIAKIATAGITRGCNPPTNDRYCPNDPVTRAQMAAFAHRAFG